MDRKSCGKKLKEYRAKRGWSGAVCAEKIGISPRYLADIERGDKVPTLETFLLILNALEASADDVLQDSLTVGYEVKSSDLLKRLDSLDAARKKYALELLDCAVRILEKA